MSVAYFFSACCLNIKNRSAGCSQGRKTDYNRDGGWPDIYHITDYSHPLIAVPLLLLFGFGISALVAATSNMISKRREAKLFCYWDKDADPVDVLIEAYALGIMTGKNSVDADIRIPIDVLSLLAKRYGLNVEDLIKPFIKGFQIGLKEKHGL